MPQRTTTIEIPSSGIEIDVVVEYDYRPGTPGRTWGLPEHCYPAESAEAEIYAASGLHSGLDLMPLLARETIAFKPWPWSTEVSRRTLLEVLTDEMVEYGDEDDHARSVRAWNAALYTRRHAA